MQATTTMSLIERLETLVESHSLQGVLAALISVCEIKADEEILLKDKAYWRRSANQLHLTSNATRKPVDERCLQTI